MAGSVKRPRRSKINGNVLIIGHESLQNGLLAELIVQHLGGACRVTPIDRVDAAPRAAVALLDVEGMSPRLIDGSVQTLRARGSYRSIALVNAERASVVDIVASSGVEGVFFSDTSKEHLIKGVKAMFGGEYWLPRSVLAAHFEKTRSRRSVGAGVSAIEPTRKETETLKLLVGGNSNNAIAQRLGVSPHTVKTHLYNLFRKIGVKNRVQAVNWATQHVERIERSLG